MVVMWQKGKSRRAQMRQALDRRVTLTPAEPVAFFAFLVGVGDRRFSGLSQCITVLEGINLRELIEQ